MTVGGRTHAKSGWRLRWLDYILLLLLVGLAAFVAWRVDGVVNYRWNWGVVPHYILRWDADAERWVANLLLEGVLTTVRISLYAGVLALVLGLVVALARLSKWLPVVWLARTYVELFRNLPPLVIVFIFYFFLSEQIVPLLGAEEWAREIARAEGHSVYGVLFGDMRHFPALLSGVIVLALFESAFVAESLRAGIQSVERGQWEAAAALGLRPGQRMRLVVLPQAVRKVIPPLANQFISLIKDSSIVSLISIQELTYRTLAMVATTRAIFEAWITTAVFYFLLCASLAYVFRRLEARLEHGHAAGPSS